MRRRFFVDKFEAESATLRGDAARHLGRVLRAEPGQLYELSNGERVWLARTEKVGRDEIEFALIEPVSAPHEGVRIHLLLSIVKFDRFEWALEKATELGVSEITPIAAERSERGLIAAAEKRAERWRRILLESAQQSRRLRVPDLHDPTKSRDAFRSATASTKILLSERAGAVPLRELIEPVASASRAEGCARMVIAVGPEGGWTEGEFATACEFGFAGAGLGTNILRTETAVCAALAAVQYAFGENRATTES